MIHKNNKNEFKIKHYVEWRNVYLDSITDSLEECKIIFYNKKHFKCWADPAIIELDKIKTYGDAILHKNSKYWRIRTLCKFILKGDIEIYDT